MIVHLSVGSGDEDAAAAVLATAGREIRAIDARLPDPVDEDALRPSRAGARALDGRDRRQHLLRPRRCRRAARAGRRLRREVVPGVAAHARDRHPHGAGRHAARRAVVDALRRPAVDGGRVWPSARCLALGIGRVLSSALYGIERSATWSPSSPRRLSLAAAALLAAYLPSRRATRLAPAEALREE